MDIHIRHAEPADVPAVTDLFARRETVFGTLAVPYPTEALWRSRIGEEKPGVRHLVAEVGDRFAGMGALHTENPSPRRQHAGEVGLVVHPDWYRKGIGSALLAALLDLADQWLNLTRLELTVYADNEAAVRLYEKFGFEREGTHRAYAFRDGRLVDALCMARVRESPRTAIAGDRASKSSQ